MFVALARTNPQGVRGVSSDLVLLFNRLPDLVTRVLVGVLQVAALVAPIGVIIYFRRGRWAELLLAAGAAVAAGLAAALLAGVLRSAVPPQVIDETLRPSWVTGSAFPSDSYLAGVAAPVTTIAPLLSMSWRRVAWWIVAMVVAARVITAVETPLNLVANVSLGIAVGSLALIVFGVPSRDGQWMFVKVVGRDERNADLLARFVRLLRVKGIEEDRPVSPRLTVEREALNALMARRAGVAAAEVLAVGETDERGAFLASEYLEGTVLRELADAELSDAVVTGAFAQLARLHTARIAHRWASIDHLLLRPDGSVALLDFRWAQLSASTRHALRDHKQLLADPRTQVQSSAGVELYELMQIQRLSLRKVILFVAFLRSDMI